MLTSSVLIRSEVIPLAINISLIKSEKVVSGSYVLNDKDPIKNIMILQTSSQYESS